MTGPLSTPRFGTVMDDETAAALVMLADAAAPSATCRPDLAETVRARGRAQSRTLRIRRTGLVAGASLAAAAAVAAATSLGHSSMLSWRQPSPAMQPAVRVGDTALVDTTLAPARADVVLVTFTANGSRWQGLARVVGLAGDQVSCPPTPSRTCAGVQINGHPLADPYLARLATAPFPAVIVPTGYVFVLGDNRDVAVDSRTLGLIPATALDGVVVQVNGPNGNQPVPGAPTHAVDDGRGVEPIVLPSAQVGPPG